MAVIVSSEKGALFYDPHYRPGALGAPSNGSESKWFDEFSVFNHLHLPKPRGLCLSPPQVLHNASSLRSLRPPHLMLPAATSCSKLSTLEPMVASTRPQQEQKPSSLKFSKSQQKQDQETDQ